MKEERVWLLYLIKRVIYVCPFTTIYENIFSHTSVRRDVPSPTLPLVLPIVDNPRMTDGVGGKVREMYTIMTTGSLSMIIIVGVKSPFLYFCVSPI